MEFHRGDIVIICSPKPSNKMLKGKKIKIYDPQAIRGTSVAASFVDKEDIKRWSAKMYIYHKDELCPLKGITWR